MTPLFSYVGRLGLLLLIPVLFLVAACDQTSLPSEDVAQQVTYDSIPRRHAKMSRSLEDIQAEAKAMAQRRSQMPLADKDPSVRPLYAEALQLVAAELYEEGLPKLTALAEQGYADAQYELGRVYTTINEGPQTLEDDRVAFEWLQRSAEQGFSSAQFFLGASYFSGNEHLAPDWGKYAEWLFIASEQGHTTAQYTLGLAYAQGEGVEKDPVEAYKWNLLAVTRAENSTSIGPTMAQMEGSLGSLIDRFQLTEVQIREAEQRAEQWEASHPWAYKSYDDESLIRTAVEDFPAEPRVQGLLNAKAKARKEKIDAIIARGSQR